jgi:hypothetical protein
MVKTSIEVQNVMRGSQVEWRTDTGGPHGEDSDRVEVYTGNVIVEYPGPSAIDQLTFYTYLPLRAAVIRTYGDATATPAPLFKATILVTPIGINGHEAEWLASVDDWHLEFLPQSFSVAPSQKFYCLILNFKLAVMNSVILRVGYQVTITTSPDIEVGELALDPTDAPTSAV